MKKWPLHIKIVVGLILGVVWALVSSAMGWSSFTSDWIAPFGTIFVNLLKLIAVPLVLFSIIVGVSSLSDIKTIGTIGIKTLGLYLVTTLMAVVLGLSLVNLIQPGKFVDKEQLIDNRMRYESWLINNNTPLPEGSEWKHRLPEYEARFNAIHDGGSEIIDSNISSKIQSAKATKDSGPLMFLVEMVPSNIFFSLGNNGLMLQVIVFALFFGITMTLIPQEKTGSLRSFIKGSNEVFLKMVDVVMQAAPFFVFALLAGKIGEIAGDDPSKAVEVFIGLSSYSLVVIIGLLLMAFVIYPLILRLVTRKIGFKAFLKGIRPAQLLAFSSSSSAATLPVTMECVHGNLGVSERITSFVLPIGATVNMDGTSLYQAIAVVFLAQFHWIDLSIGQQLTIVLTATLASIGSAAVPSAGLIMLIIVLESVGLNPAWIAIIFPVDRILDMCRTVVNVTGDATVSTIIASQQGELQVPHVVSGDETFEI